jgi:DNA-binding CsgD family transcriptional regulator
MNYLGEVVGRTAELTAIDEFLNALDEGPTALVLEGEPGVGKTTLVQAAVDEAERRGARVLSFVANASEACLPYVALATLLAGVESEQMEALPPPQRDALDAALLDAGSRLPDPCLRAVATAVLSLLEALAEDQPLVIAIDGLQWLDRPSARVVEFCARRFMGRVGLVASRRAGATVAGELRLRQPERMDVLRLAPLDTRALRQVVGQRVEQPLALSALERVNEASGGNLNYALELARALPVDGPPPPALLLPPRLRESVESRLAGLDHELEEVLLAVAALAKPTIALVSQALGPEATRLLDEAEDRGLVNSEGHRLRFTHPLLAIGIQARASLARLCRMHRRLSAVVPDVEERARHLAYAQVVPDAVPALDEAARNLRARGEPAAAAELLELARGLGGHSELQVRAAEHHLDAGDSTRAQALLEKTIPALGSGPARAEALLLLAEIRYHDDRRLEALSLLEEAQAETDLDDWLRASIDLRLGFLLFDLGSPHAATVPTALALARAELVGDDALLAQALALSVTVDYALGMRIDERRLNRALELERPDVRTTGLLRPTLIASFLYLRTGRLDESRRLLVALCDGQRERGEEHDLAWTCLRLAATECWRGDLEAATRAADEAFEHLVRLEMPGGRGLALTVRAQVDAYSGRADAARRGAAEALALLEEGGWRRVMWRPLGILCFVELSLGDHEAAAARLPSDVLGIAAREPLTLGGSLLCADAAEALIAVGRADEAEPLVDVLMKHGSAPGRPTARGLAARCRGLLLAEAGDLAGAERMLQRAVAAHERVPMRLEHARSLLALARVQRRRRQRTLARTALEEALAIFDAVGSPLWAEQARAELARIRPSAGAAGDLTIAEERVARLAAEGRTNREVAANLYLSPKTVEVHLSRAYRKLGIRSRAELGATMAGREQTTLPEDSSQAA